VLSAAATLLLVLSGPQPDTLTSAVVTAQTLGPAPTAVVSGPLLETSASAADAVRSFTGLQLKDYGGVGGLKTVNVRSLGSEHLGVYIDGIPVDRTQNMQVDLGRLSTWGWESAALYQGQKSDALQSAREYGTASALHFRSAAPETAQLRLRALGGAFGTFSGAALWDRPLGRRGTALRLSAEAQRTAGDFRYGLSSYRDGRPFDTTLVRENGDLKALRAEATLFGRIPEGEWRLGVNGYLSDRGYPGPVIRRAEAFPLSADRQQDRTLSLHGSLQRRYSSGYALALRGLYTDDWTHFATHPERNPMALPFDSRYRQRMGYLSVSQALSLAERWGLSLAFDGQYNTLDSDVGQFVQPTRLSLIGALAGRYASPHFQATASLQGLAAWDRFDADAGGFSRENRRRAALSPFVQALWRPLSALEVSAFFKRSYRLPSFNDLYYTLIGNANLSPESARQLGLDLRWMPASASGLIPSARASSSGFVPSARASLYRNRVRDKIVAIPTSSQFRWTMLNLGTVDITGAELEAGLRYSDGGARHCRPRPAISSSNADSSSRHCRLRSSRHCRPRPAISAGLTLRYTYQRAVDHTDPSGPTYGNQIPYIPLHSGSIAFDASWCGWRLDWITVLTGLRYSRTANIPDYEVPAFSTTDLRLSRSWSFRGFDLTLRGSVNNLFDQPYAVVQGYPMPGIHALLGAEICF